MSIVFYLSSAVAIIATALAITRVNAVHALLYLILSFLSVAMVFYALGAVFIAALEVIVYAGAIVVLFIFVVMLLNPGRDAEQQEKKRLAPKVWIGPGLLALLLVAELLFMLAQTPKHNNATLLFAPKQVGITLFGPYLLGVELAAILLLAGLVGAFHLGKRDVPAEKSPEGW